uniref:Ig-like domain-containing protein n=1 Tax=Oreochromis aureus TaxID=47969 RepID=A0AAZ1WZE7_OREAU
MYKLLYHFYTKQNIIHALAPLVEVYEGEISVPLLCKYSGFIPEDNPTVLWTRNDLNPKSVHLRREETDDLKGQHQRYRGLRPDGLEMKDFSLTLTKPKLTDSGNYTCSIGNGRNERKLTDVQLHVKAVLVLLVLLLLLILVVVSGGLLFYFRHYFMPGELQMFRADT